MEECTDDIILQASGLSKHYRIAPSSRAPNADFWAEKVVFKALDNISFTLQKGEVIGVIGRNGSGKSTLLKILSEVVYPTSGHFTYKGRLMSILDIGSGFHPELTGRENAYMHGAMLGISKNEIKSRLHEIIAFSDIGSYFDMPVKYYSNGMYLRVAFAVSFFMKADILILDEVLAVGDTEFMIRCYQRIRDLIAEGLSIILVSHSMSDIIGLCNRCIWLDKGKIAAIGPATDVVGEYLQSGWGALESSHQKTSLFIRWNIESCPKSLGFHLLEVKAANIGISDIKGPDLDYNLPVKFEITFFNSEPDQNYSLVLILIDKYNVPVLLSTHHFQRDDLIESNIFGMGTYRCSCTVPAQMLNVGTYKLQLRVLKDLVNQLLDLSGLLIFKITSSYPSQNNALMATPVTFASYLGWKTEKLS